MVRAASALVWKGLRREVFMFRSGDDLLYGSWYAPADRAPAFRLVLCPPWGWEASRLQNALHVLARRGAELGGASLFFQWPGHGDSSGELDSLTLPIMASAVSDAVVEAGNRATTGGLILAGVRLGAAVAAMTATGLGVEALLLIQPCLDPEAFFEQAAASGRRARLGRQDTPGWWFGQPLPERIQDSAQQADVLGALATFQGSGSVLRYASPALEVPPGFREVVVPGSWRLAPRDAHAVLFEEAVDRVRPLATTSA